MEDRILALEVKNAYQERLLAALDEVLQAMAKRVDALERELARLRASQIRDAEGNEGPDEPPPHY